MIIPPQLWPTSTHGPARSSTRRVAATSASRPVKGSCTTCTLYPWCFRISATGFQPDPSANEPCTRTTLLTALSATESKPVPSNVEKTTSIVVFMQSPHALLTAPAGELLLPPTRANRLRATASLAPHPPDGVFGRTCQKRIRPWYRCHPWAAFHLRARYRRYSRILHRPRPEREK